MLAAMEHERTRTKPDGWQKRDKLRTIAYTKTFKKDYQRMAAAGRYDMTLVNEVGGLLIARHGSAGAGRAVERPRPDRRR